MSRESKVAPPLSASGDFYCFVLLIVLRAAPLVLSRRSLLHPRSALIWAFRDDWPLRVVNGAGTRPFSSWLVAPGLCFFGPELRLTSFRRERQGPPLWSRLGTLPLFRLGGLPLAARVFSVPAGSFSSCPGTERNF